MATKLTKPFPYVYPDKDRQGRPRWRYRPPGGKATVTIRGAYGSPAFAEAYRAAAEGIAPIERKGLGVPRSGTIAALRTITYKHPYFTGKKQTTQRSLRSYIDRMATLEGEKPVASLRQEDVQRRVNTFAAAGKDSAARNFLNAVRLLHKVAVAEHERKKGDDPTAGVELPKIKGNGYRTWEDDEAAAFEDAYPYGKRERFIYAAYAFTALRRSDIARLGPRLIRPRREIVCIGQYRITHDLVLPWIAKNGEPLRLPVLPWLQRAIDELPPSDDMVFFPAPNGKPLSGKRIADILREACLAIGLGPKIVDDSGKPKCLSGHGLRKFMGKRLAELCGCSELQIMSVLGQRDPRSAKIYTEGAGRSRMAEDALFALVAKLAEQEQARTPILPTPVSALPTRLQHFGNKGK